MFQSEEKNSKHQSSFDLEVLICFGMGNTEVEIL